MSKIVVGDYANPMDASARVQELIAAGFPSDSLSLIADKAAAKELSDIGVKVERDFDYVENVSDETLFQKIKGFFGFDTAKLYDENIAAYSQSIRNGNVIVVADGTRVSRTLLDRYIGGATREVEVETEYVPERDTMRHAALDNQDDATIRLEAERMQVDKQSVQAGQAVIHKRVVEDVETVEVPVRHEEVYIERVPLSDQDVTTADFAEETINIPVMEEQVIVSKRPVVTEEIRVHKRDVQGSQDVSETLRREELEVDEVGNANIHDQERITH